MSLFESERSPGLVRAALLTALLTTAGLACSVDTTGLPPINLPGDSGTDFDAGKVGPFPWISIVSEPSGTVSGEATVQFLLFETELFLVDVAATWFVGGGALNPATQAPGSNLLFGITASPDGALLTFVWSSVVDAPGDIDNVGLCFQATSDGGTGNLACTEVFDVRNGAPGWQDIRIDEIDTGDEDAVEVINTGAETVDISGFVLAWTDTTLTSGALPIPPGIEIDPGARLVLRENKGPGGPNDVFLGQNLNWSGLTGGSVVLRDRVGNDIDFVRWGGSPEIPGGPAGWTETAGLLPIPAGGDITLSRTAAADTDDSGDFCLTAPTLGDANETCLVFDALAPSDLVINEVNTGFPDLIEVVNTTGATIDLLGIRVLWSNPFDGGFLTLPSYALAAGDHVIVADDMGTPGPGVIVGNANIGWGVWVGGGSAGLLDGNGNGVDFVRWGMDTTPVPVGLSFDDGPGVLRTWAATVNLTRVPEAVDTDSTLDFCLAAPTQGAANTNPCLDDGAVGDVLITEAGVGIPDWVEITNVGATTVELLGWRLVWSRTSGGGGQMAGIFSLPGYTLAPGERVVLADDPLPVMIPNELVFSGPGTNITWGMPSGWGGAAGLFGPYGAGEDFVRWGGSTSGPFGDLVWSEPGGGVAAPASDDETVNRDETLGDNDVDTDWCIESTGTVGLPNDTCP